MEKRKRGIFNERHIQGEEVVDFTLPVIPPFDVVLATPIVIPRDAWTPVPVNYPPDFFDELVAETYAVMGTVHTTSPDNAASEASGNVVEEVEVMHSTINGAGRLLHAIAFHLQDGTPGNTIRFLTNWVETAWLDFNAYSVKWDPRLEIAHIEKLLEQVREIRKIVMQEVTRTWPTPHAITNPNWPPLFEMSVRSISAGARRVRVVEEEAVFIVSFEATTGDKRNVVIAHKHSPQDTLAELCDIIDLLARDEQTLLASIQVPDTPLNSKWQTRRDTIRNRFKGNPCVTPEIFLLRKYVSTVRHVHAVLLEPSNTLVFERLLNPGESRWVAVMSWESNRETVSEGLSCIDSTLPEGREILKVHMERAFPSKRDFFPRLTYMVPPERVEEIPQRIVDALVEHVKVANAHREFFVQEITSEADARALGRARSATMPTQALGTNVLEMVNKGMHAITVKYLKTQKTYRVEIALGGVELLYWDGAKRVQLLPNALASFFAPLFRPGHAILKYVIIPAVEQATLEASPATPIVTTEVRLFKPIAVPAGYLERFLRELQPRPA